jgi:hypothetical protein
MGPLPVPSEDEENVVVKWANDCSRKEFLQRKVGVSLSVQ